MPKNDIGGFFVSLGLNPDKNSFETGNKLIDSVSISLNKLIGTARNAAVALTGTALVTGEVEQANLKTSAAIGVSVDALNTWKAAAKITDVNAGGLIGSMSKLSNVMNHMTIDGSGLEAYADQLWKLGLGFEELEELSPDEAFKKIFEAAQDMLANGANQTEVAMRVQDVLGDDAMNFFIEMNRQGLTIAELLNTAGKTVFTTEEDANRSADFVVEVNTLKAEVESIGKLIGSEAAGILTPYVDDVNKWLQGHGDEIRDTVSKLFTTTEKVIGDGVKKLSNWWDKNGDGIKGNLENIYGITTKIIGTAIKTIGDWWQQHGDEVLEVLSTISTLVATITSKLIGSKKAKETFSWLSETNTAALKGTAAVLKTGWDGGDLFGALYNATQEFFDNLLSPITNKINPYNPQSTQTEWNDTWWQGVNDGIIRPDGTVTQVAPDDWVFAARNVGDLARAFVPQAQMVPTSTNQEYTINQTFNIQGGANDIPAVIKQQAYRGTQDALLLAMQQSSNRLQQMSGTR